MVAIICSLTVAPCKFITLLYLKKANFVSFLHFTLVYGFFTVLLLKLSVFMFVVWIILLIIQNKINSIKILSSKCLSFNCRFSIENLLSYNIDNKFFLFVLNKVFVAARKHKTKRNKKKVFILHTCDSPPLNSREENYSFLR